MCGESLAADCTQNSEEEEVPFFKILDNKKQQRWLVKEILEGFYRKELWLKNTYEVRNSYLMTCILLCLCPKPKSFDVID